MASRVGIHHAGARMRAGARVVAALAGALLAGCGGAPRETPEAPAAATSTPAQGKHGPASILLITLDTTRADRLGCYGRQAAQTPTLDRWAREGTLFERAFTPVPITLPAHASLLTGLWPHHHGARDNAIYRVSGEGPSLAATLKQAGYATAAVVGAAVLDRAYGLDRGFDVYDDHVARQGLAIAERDAASVTDRALAVAAGLSRPFLLWVHYYDPHAAYRPPEPFATRFAASPYEGEIAYVDSQLARLREGLESRGLLSGALVAVTADHGEGLGEHGEETHGVFLYQSTLHVPLILGGPGWPAGTRLDAPVSLVDVAPTLLAAAGVGVPDGFDGVAVSAQAPRGSLPVPLESEFGFNSYGWARLAGLTDGRWKWIRAPREELYDLQTDPGEQHDVSATQPDRRHEMEAAWRGALVGERRGAGVADASDAAAAGRLAQLRSLGYTGAGTASGGDERDGADPKDAITSLDAINRARAHIGRREFAAAEAALQEAMAVSPRNVSALVLLGSARLMQGRPGDALEPLAHAEKLSPLNADIHFNQGLARLGVGDVPGAEAAWRRTLELMPRYTDAAVNLADLLERTDRPGEAETVVTSARQAGVSGVLLDFVEGRLAARRGQSAVARQLLERALAGGLPAGAADEARSLLARLRG